MKFELRESMRTGIEQIDADHWELIACVNSIAGLGESADTAALVAALARFRTDLATHFQSEETHMGAVNYPKLGSHAKHHAETIEALDRLIRDVQTGAPTEGGVAHICYHELISVVLLRDMQFINWMADRPRLGE